MYLLIIIIIIINVHLETLYIVQLYHSVRIIIISTLGWYSEPGHISYDGRKSASVVNWYSETGHISGHISLSLFPRKY